jgi:hypothetical protein
MPLARTVHRKSARALGGVLARLELRACDLIFRLGLLLPDFDILVSRKLGAAFLLLAIASADR